MSTTACVLLCFRHLFVHDLVTSEATRSGGHGAALIQWLEAEARAHGCSRCQCGLRYLSCTLLLSPCRRTRQPCACMRRLVLDSNTERQNAHRFYHKHGLTIRSFHFAKELT